VDDVRNVVRTMVRAGADAIKCATTGGASSRTGHGPMDPAFDRDEMQALVDEAHALGRKVLCHALGGPGLRLALEAGVDSIEHGCYLDDDPELLSMMAQHGVFFVPTLTVYEYHRESPAPHVRERARALRDHHLESIRRALAAGVRVVAGTDAGGHGHPPNAAELAHLVAAGLTPMQAIQAATGLAAECVGLEREIGTLEKGKRADLVVVEGDPLADARSKADPAGGEGRSGRGPEVGRRGLRPVDRRAGLRRRRSALPRHPPAGELPDRRGGRRLRLGRPLARVSPGPG
jgi:imidazolonepropionase-like amidohydrolase